MAFTPGYRKIQADPSPYSSFVAAQSRLKPCLEQLSRFLSKETPMQYDCRISQLEFYAASEIPKSKSLDMTELASLLRDERKGNTELRGRILIVEDLTKDIVELLGSTLNIDPFFFASHIDVFQRKMTTSEPYLATLPSMANHSNFLNLHYHRALQFDGPISQRTLVRAMNVPRKVKLLPPAKGFSIGLARHCCSILKTVEKDGLWLSLVLVDASTNMYSTFGQQRGEVTTPALFQSKPFQGGFQDFRFRPSFEGPVSWECGPKRRSLREDLIFYWCNGEPQGLDLDAPTLVSLSQYPLRIIAAEWMVYLQVIYHTTKQYEFTPDTVSAALEQISTLYTNLSELQKWARRNMATTYKLRYAIDFLKSNTMFDQDMDLKALLLQDYSHIASTVDLYGRRLNEMVPIVTSIIQLIDSRRSLIETTNVSRLTHLAMVFVPLTFASQLFSMQDEVAPGGKSFWLYFAVAIPLCFIVYLVARPPTTGIIARAIWNSKRMRLLRG